jgi:hypothetical protein
MGEPHSPQNLAPGRLDAPQLAQAGTNDEPHSSQNFLPSAFSVPQLAQIMG